MIVMGAESIFEVRLCVKYSQLLCLHFLLCSLVVRSIQGHIIRVRMRPATNDSSSEAITTDSKRAGTTWREDGGLTPIGTATSAIRPCREARSTSTAMLSMKGTNRHFAADQVDIERDDVLVGRLSQGYVFSAFQESSFPRSQIRDLGHPRFVHFAGCF